MEPLEIYTLAALAAPSITFILQIFFMISFISHVTRNPKTSGPVQRVALCTYITTAIYCLCAICLLLFGSGGQFYIEIKSHQHLFFTTTVFAKSVAIMCFYAFILCRLQYTFQGSAYEVSQRSLRCYWLFVFVNPILILAISWWVIVGKDRLIAGYKYDYIHSGIAVILMTLMSNGIVIHLTYRFCHNLYRLVLAQHSTLTRAPRSPPSCSSTENPNCISSKLESKSSLNERQIGLLQTATKQTVLGIAMGVAVNGCLVTLAVTVFVQLEVLEDGVNRTIIFWAMSLLFIGLTSSIYLGFRVNEKYYDKCFGICHRRMERICQSMAERNVAVKLAESSEL